MIFLWLGVICFASFWDTQSVQADPINGWFIALIFSFALDFWILIGRIEGLNR